MSNSTNHSIPVITNLPFHSVRNISCPEDIENDRKIYIGHTKISNVLRLSTDENVRDYLLEAEGRKKRKQTQVHKAITDTLDNQSNKFSVLNSGITIVARACEIDESNKQLKLTRPSIINGAQTQGIIKDYINSLEDVEPNWSQEPHVKYEIVVTMDEALIAEISISRNFQNPVKNISIVGRLGYLDELEVAFQKKYPNQKLQKSETKLSEDYLKTEKLLQVIAALIPEEIWYKDREFSKGYTYSQKSKCLKDFNEIYEKRGLEKGPYKELYKFYLDICHQAYDLYVKWKTNQGWKGTGLRNNVIKQKSGKVTDVSDGLIFPIIASLSEFVSKTENGWVLNVHKDLSDSELIEHAKVTYMEIAKSNPNVMGKHKACYSSLRTVTSIYKKLTKH